MKKTFPSDVDEDDAVPRVVVVNHNPIRGEVHARWIGEQWLCELITDPDGAVSHLAQSHLVVCLWSQTDEGTDLVRSIWESYPHIQVLILLSREEFTGLDRRCDESLQEPFSRPALQSTVRRLLKRGLYSLKVRQCYHLGSYLTSTEKYDLSDVAGDEEDLKAKIATLKDEIRTLAEDMDESELDAVRQALLRRRQSVQQPTVSANQGQTSKYHPSACPDCGLAWGVSHGQELGQGFTRVAALVWRCTGCGELHKIAPGEYDKIL